MHVDNLGSRTPITIQIKDKQGAASKRAVAQINLKNEEWGQVYNCQYYMNYERGRVLNRSLIHNIRPDANPRSRSN